MKKLAFLIAVLGAAAVAFILFVGFRLTAPVQVPIGDPPAALEAHEVAFDSTSGAVVRGWFAEAQAPKGVVVLLPGVRANRLSMVDRALFLRRSGYSVLLIDLQATGETLGRNITFGWLESRDVLAAVQFVRRQAPGVPVIILGTSLGGAAALLATPPLRVDAMILEAVYPTVERATENRLTMRFGPFGKLGAPLLLAQLRPRLGISPKHLRPVDHISRVTCPVLIIGGARDRHSTPRDTQFLFERAADPKELWLVPGAAHVDFHSAVPAEYERRVVSFLDSRFTSG